MKQKPFDCAFANFIVKFIVVTSLIITTNSNLVQCNNNNNNNRNNNSTSTSTLQQRKAFIAFLNVHQANHTLLSNFTSSNSVIDNLREYQRGLLVARNLHCVTSIRDLKLQNNYDQLVQAVDADVENKMSWTDAAAKWNNMCVGSDAMVEYFGGGLKQEENVNHHQAILRLITGQLSNLGCDMCTKEKMKMTKSESESAADQKVPASKITRLETWGYGILFVTVISLTSLCGAAVIPFSKKKIYKKMLLFLIAIAVGSLAGSGFLHLIPQAFGITEDDKYAHNHAYVWKGLTMMGGVYLFYLVEKIMKIMIMRRKKVAVLKKINSKQDGFESKELLEKSNTLSSPDNNNDNNNNESNNKLILKASASSSANKKCSDNKNCDENNNPDILESIGYLKGNREGGVEASVEMRTHLNETAQKNFEIQRNNHHGHSHSMHSVAPVAWMIIFGDGLHNFIDGLSIGAAFTDNILKGISISLAVICEEFPHELGDFAILINAGMPYHHAILFNFLSACCCYAGLAVGIVLGENFGLNEWIYALAGGMFLYISLCDMIPELNEMGDEIERDYLLEKKQNELVNSPSPVATLSPSSSKTGSIEDEYEDLDLTIKFKVFFLQNLGIIVGFGFMLVMAFYAEKINL